MSCYYKLYQDNRKTGNKLIYARAVHPGTTDLSDIADKIEHNTSMTRGDVLSVLTELVTVMKADLQDGKVVKLNGFGSFRMNLTSKGATSVALWDAGKCIVGSHCRFLAEGVGGASNATRTFNAGISWKMSDASWTGLEEDASGE